MCIRVLSICRYWFPQGVLVPIPQWIPRNDCILYDSISNKISDNANISTVTERRLPGDEVGVCVLIMKGHEKTESNRRVHYLDCGDHSTGTHMYPNSPYICAVYCISVISQ